MKSDTVVEAFHKLKTREDVAQILGIKDTSLRYFLYKRRPENMYSSFSIPKRDGTMRQISAPAKQLKTIQQKLAAILAQVYKPKVCAYGFIPGLRDPHLPIVWPRSLMEVMIMRVYRPP